MSATLKAEDIFNLADFQTMETTFTMIKNLTTRTEPESLAGVRVVEIGEKSLAFELEKNCGAKGHSIILGLKITCPEKGGPAKVVKFEATTTVSDCVKQDDGTYRYDVELVQFEEKGWQQFLELFNSRQNEINEFLSAVKG
jgi:hypothetical protein